MEIKFYLILLAYLIISLLKGFQESRNFELIEDNPNINFKIRYILEHIYLLFLFTLTSYSLITKNPLLRESWVLVSYIIYFFITSLRRYKALFSNSLQSHYENVSLIVSLFIISESYLAALFISSTLLISSISAGFEKIKSKIWRFNGFGMQRFLTLPWVTRDLIRNLSTYLYQRFSFYKFSINILTVLVPYLQIFSGATLLFLVFTFNTGNTIFYFLSLSTQIVFALLLFIIADLTWIPFFYIWLLMAMNATTTYINDSRSIISIFSINDISSLFEIISIIYISLFFFLAFNNVKLKYFYKLFKTIGITTGPFKMFTERNTENMISFFVNKNSTSKFINPFLKNGKRSSKQNLNTRLYHDLLYPIGDYFMLNTKAGTTEKFLSNYHKKQCFAVFKNSKNSNIDLFQHIWDREKGCYKKPLKIGNLIINHTGVPIGIQTFSKPHAIKR